MDGYHSQLKVCHIVLTSNALFNICEVPIYIITRNKNEVLFVWS